MEMERIRVITIILFSIVSAIHCQDAGQYCQNGWDSFRTSCYKFVQVRKTYSEALRACNDEGASLACVSDEHEENILELRLYVNSWNAMWIGLRKATNFEHAEKHYYGLGQPLEQWKWSDGSEYRYSSWKSSDERSESQCAMIHLQGWMQHPCDTFEYYICEKGLGSADENTEDGTVEGRAVDGTTEVSDDDGTIEGSDDDGTTERSDDDGTTERSHDDNTTEGTNDDPIEADTGRTPNSTVVVAGVSVLVVCVLLVITIILLVRKRRTNPKREPENVASDQDQTNRLANEEAEYAEIDDQRVEKQERPKNENAALLTQERAAQSEQDGQTSHNQAVDEAIYEDPDQVAYINQDVVVYRNIPQAVDGYEVPVRQTIAPYEVPVYRRQTIAPY